MKIDHSYVNLFRLIPKSVGHLSYRCEGIWLVNSVLELQVQSIRNLLMEDQLEQFGPIELFDDRSGFLCLFTKL
jgi:hypothetical protein